ncbi:unnamed protein product, partial [Mesorhabditis belari]|uniref:Uncharacterized protein n=1 Tax=Mesorhabditis belari TaxID=2138241 RepID=A0AAF3EJR1_9BILA
MITRLLCAYLIGLTFAQFGEQLSDDERKVDKYAEGGRPFKNGYNDMSDGFKKERKCKGRRCGQDGPKRPGGGGKWPGKEMGGLGGPGRPRPRGEGGAEGRALDDPFGGMNGFAFEGEESFGDRPMFDERLEDQQTYVFDFPIQRMGLGGFSSAAPRRRERRQQMMGGYGPGMEMGMYPIGEGASGQGIRGMGMMGQGPMSGFGMGSMGQSVRSGPHMGVGQGAGPMGPMGPGGYPGMGPGGMDMVPPMVPVGQGARPGPMSSPFGEINPQMSFNMPFPPPGQPRAPMEIFYSPRRKMINRERRERMMNDYLQGPIPMPEPMPFRQGPIQMNPSMPEMRPNNVPMMIRFNQNDDPKQPRFMKMFGKRNDFEMNDGEVKEMGMKPWVWKMKLLKEMMDRGVFGERNDSPRIPTPKEIIGMKLSMRGPQDRPEPPMPPMPENFVNSEQRPLMPPMMPGSRFGQSPGPNMPEMRPNNAPMGLMPSRMSENSMNTDQRPLMPPMMPGNRFEQSPDPNMPEMRPNNAPMGLMPSRMSENSMNTDQRSLMPPMMPGNRFEQQQMPEMRPNDSNDSPMRPMPSRMNNQIDENLPTPPPPRRFDRKSYRSSRFQSGAPRWNVMMFGPMDGSQDLQEGSMIQLERGAISY